MSLQSSDLRRLDNYARKDKLYTELGLGEAIDHCLEKANTYKLRWCNAELEDCLRMAEEGRSVVFIANAIMEARKDGRY